MIDHDSGLPPQRADPPLSNSRRILVITPRSLLGILVSLSLASLASAEKPTHFDPKGKPPSQHTIRGQKALRASLPFDDERDFAEAKKGFIAAPKERQIRNQEGEIVWDIGAFDFLLGDEEFDSIHPSLRRQALLNMNYGLYKLSDEIYQVRGFDLANLTLVKGETGWIIFDVLTAKETAAAAMALVEEHLGKRPVKAIIYSHSHADHFAGVRGVVNEEDVRSGKVQILAPEGFLHHAVAENVFAGNAMNRRLFFQYGTLLPRHPTGHVDQSIGKAVAAGTAGLIRPTREIDENMEEITIDGVRMIFHLTPNTEAPAEMNTWFPDLKAFWAAENITGTIHNVYTLRGALVRDANEWSKQINVALREFGGEAELMFASHSWPRWGNARIQEVMRAQRDLYAYLNSQALHLANQGVTINQIQNIYDPPESLKTQWAARSYHGSNEHNSRAVVNRYLGYWDANPTTLIPLSPADSAPLYVEMMGGSQKILERGRELHDAGDYRLAQEILDKLVHAEPTNQVARDLLADVWEQIGYQQESPSVRNSFLAAAYELRNGVPEGRSASTVGPDFIEAMTTGMFFDFMAIRLDSTQAGDDEFTINLVTPDTGEQYIVELSNGVLTNIEGYQAPEADLTFTVDRRDLDQIFLGRTRLANLIEEGKAKAEGDFAVIGRLMGYQVDFDPRFQMVPGAGKPADVAPKQNVFEK
jgi:alkyl sulfatase BDS1-like metallo-beta-lactamase superfamily hydrolase